MERLETARYPQSPSGGGCLDDGNRMLLECPLTKRVTRFAESGLTIRSIAQRLDLHPSSVYRRLVAAGRRRCWTPVTDAERRRIRDLIAADNSRRAVARSTGRGLGTISRIAKPNDSSTRRLRSAVRCKTCRAKIVQLPCVACEARAAAS